jgi:hypothetical protein
MRQFMINPLSVCAQCHEITSAHKIFEDFIACLKYIWPMVHEERAALSCAPEMENGELIVNEAFLATLNRLRALNGDLPRLWYQYTKNRPYSPENRVEVTISSVTSSDESKKGVIEAQFSNPAVIWISFGGTKLNMTSPIAVTRADGESYVATNAHDEKSIEAVLPIFKHHDKHREEPYYDYERNEDVAAMPIRDPIEAGVLLRIGISDGSDILSYHRLSKKFYRFKLTGGNVYHGFEIMEKEVPSALLLALTEK